MAQENAYANFGGNYENDQRPHLDAARPEQQQEAEEEEKVPA